MINILEIALEWRISGRTNTGHKNWRCAALRRSFRQVALTGEVRCKKIAKIDERTIESGILPG